MPATSEVRRLIGPGEDPLGIWVRDIEGRNGTPAVLSMAIDERVSKELDVTTPAEAAPGALIVATRQQLANLSTAGMVGTIRDGWRQPYRIEDTHVPGGHRADVQPRGS